MAGKSIELNPSFPPLLPLTLAGLARLGIDPLAAIRFLNMGLFAATVLLSYRLLLSIQPCSLPIAFLGALSILLSGRLIELFASAMSEPLYLTLMIGGLSASIRYLDQRQSVWLMVAGVLLGLAAFTRYAGVASIAAVAFVLLIRRHPGTQTSPARMLAFLGLRCAPIATYSLHNLLSIGRPVGHAHWSWELVQQFPWRSLVRNCVDWLVPGKFVAGLEAQIVIAAAAVSGAAMAAYAILFRRSPAAALARQLRKGGVLVLTANTLALLLLLALSRGFFAGGDSFNRRYLAPVQVTAFILLFALAAAAANRSPRWARAFVLGACLCFTLLLTVRAVWTVRHLWREGSGYSSRRRHISETIRYLNNRPEVPVMSTAAPGVYFWTGRLPADIPRTNPREEVRAFLCRTGGFLVIIDSMPAEFYGVDQDELTRGLLVEQDFSEGTIYRIDPSECEGILPPGDE